MTVLPSTVRDAAFALAFDGQASPLAYELHDDAALAARLEVGSQDERRLAVAAVRSLCDVAYQVAEWYREGRLGDPPSSTLAIRSFARLAPGFTDLHYEVALAAGLFWTR